MSQFEDLHLMELELSQSHAAPRSPIRAPPPQKREEVKEERKGESNVKDNNS